MLGLRNDGTYFCDMDDDEAIQWMLEDGRTIRHIEVRHDAPDFPKIVWDEPTGDDPVTDYRLTEDTTLLA